MWHIIGKGTTWQIELAFHRDGSILYRFLDKARYWSKIRIFDNTLPAFDAPDWGSLSEYYHSILYRKTRMVCQPHGEKFENNFFVSIQYTKVTDRLTDRRTPHDGINRAMHSIAASRSKKNSQCLSKLWGTNVVLCRVACVHRLTVYYAYRKATVKQYCKRSVSSSGEQIWKKSLTINA